MKISHALLCEGKLSIQVPKALVALFALMPKETFPWGRGTYPCSTCQFFICGFMRSTYCGVSNAGKHWLNTGSNAGSYVLIRVCSYYRSVLKCLKMIHSSLC